MVGMWQHPEEHSAVGVLGVIVGTVVALWLATIIAARMSYRMVHDSSELEPKMQEARTSASGLLAPVATPAFFCAASYTRGDEYQDGTFYQCTFVGAFTLFLLALCRP